MNDLASEFFHDGIAHVPPGFLIIVLYWRTEAENIFHTHRDFFSSPILFIACVLAVAWLVGFVVDFAAFALVAYVLRKLSPYCDLISRLRLRLLDEKTPEKLPSLKERITELEVENACLREENEKLTIQVKRLQSQTAAEDLEHVDKDLEREKRRQHYLRVAEKIMCRCLWVTFLFAWLASIVAWFHPLAWFHPPEPFSNLHWDGYYYFGGFFVFLVVWIWLQTLRQKMGDRPKKAPTSREIR